MTPITDIKNFKNGGMDTDSSPEAVDPNDYISAYNIRVTGSSEQEDGYATNIESSELMGLERPEGINKCIGTRSFESVHKAYSFIYNSNKRHQLVEFDYDAGVETVLFENITDSGGEDVLPLDPQFYITDIQLINDIFLTWTTGNIPPCYINLQRLKNGSYGVIRKEDIWLIKPQILPPPKSVYNDDSTRSVNLLSQKLFQFAVQGRFLDDEQSAWSTRSKRAVPERESTPAIGTDVTKYNNLIVSTDIGNDRIKELNIAARYDELDWSLVKTVSREHILSLTHTEVNVAEEIYEGYDPVTNIYSFAFYNDGIYTPVDVLETDLFSDNVPEQAGALEVINGNIIALGDLTEGKVRPTTKVNISSTSYDPGITITPVDNSNRLQTSWSQNTRIGGSHRRRVTTEFTGLPKTGDILKIRVGDLDSKDFIDYSYTVTPSEENNLYETLKKLAEQIPNSSVGYSPYDSNFIGINFTTAAYYELKSFSVELANAGTGESRSIHGVKSNSAYQLALSYRDEFGRPFPLRTDDSFIVKTLSYSQARGLTPQINWSILTEEAPEGAVDYQWLITKNNTHETTLFVDCKIYETLTDYIVLDLNPLKRFNNTNSSSVLNYAYTKGDRCTFHYYEDGGKQWYDGQNHPSVDVEVVGFELRPIPDNPDTPENDEDVKWLLKVRKSPSIDIPTITNKTIVIEVYSPRKRTETVGGSTALVDTVFYEIGERYTITNGKHDVLSDVIKEGDVYFKTRQIVDAIDPSTVITLLVEDFNFSDFYTSNFTSYGRARTYYDVKEKSRRKASIRYSDPFVLGSKNNGLTRFYDTRIYGDGDGESSSSYGAIIKMRQRGNSLIVLQELLVGYIPVFVSIVEDQAAQEQSYLSDKLLNKIRYNPSVNTGIGNAKESYAEFGSNLFFIDPFRSEPIRAGLDGVKPISDKMSKWFKRVLQRAYKQGKKIIGWYDVFNKEYVVSIETEGDILISFKFDASQWKYEEDYTIPPGGITISTPPTKGMVSYNSSTGKAIYTPNNGQTGNDSFQYSFTVNSQVITKRECIVILAGDKDVNGFSFIDVNNAEINTLYSSNTILVDGNNVPVQAAVSGGEMSINGGSWVTAPAMVNAGDIIQVRRTSSPSYSTLVQVTLTVSNQSDTFDIMTRDPDPDPNPDPFYFTEVENANLSTLYESNEVTIAGTNVPSTLSISGGEYSKNGGSYTSAPGTINSGDTLKLRVQSSPDYLTQVTVTVTVQSYSTGFIVTTKEEDSYPFRWVAKTSTQYCEKEIVEQTTFTGFASPINANVYGNDLIYADASLGGYVRFNPTTIASGTDASNYGFALASRSSFALLSPVISNRLYVNTFQNDGIRKIDLDVNSDVGVIPYGFNGAYSRGNIYYIQPLNEIWGVGSSFVRFKADTEEISNSPNPGFSLSGVAGVLVHNNKIYTFIDSTNSCRVYDSGLNLLTTINGICANTNIIGQFNIRGFYVDVANDLIYVGEVSSTGGIVVISTTTDIIVNRINIDKEGYSQCAPAVIGFHPLRNTVYVGGALYSTTSDLHPRLWAFDVATQSIVQTLSPVLTNGTINDIIYYPPNNSVYISSAGRFPESSPNTGHASDGVLIKYN